MMQVERSCLPPPSEQLFSGIQVNCVAEVSKVDSRALPEPFLLWIAVDCRSLWRVGGWHLTYCHFGALAPELKCIPSLLDGSFRPQVFRLI